MKLHWRTALRWFVRLTMRSMISITVVINAVWFWLAITEVGVTEPQQIADGVTYTVLDLPGTSHGGGLAYVAMADMTHPAVRFYVTPPDYINDPAGFDYRLRFPWQEARHKKLAAAINGSFFKSKMYKLSAGELYAPNAPAQIVYTAVSDGQTLFGLRQPCLIWFDQQGMPHAERLIPRTNDRNNIMGRASIVLSAWRFIVENGVPRQELSEEMPTMRAAIGVNTKSHRVWLAVFESADELLAGQVLAEEGATDAIVLDGGGSTCFVVGANEGGVTPGVRLRGWRPVAQTIGIQADN